MTIVNALLGWLKTCPELSNGTLNLDWLPESAREYCIDVIPCDEVLRRYTTGGARKQFLFYLASRTFVGDDTRDACDSYEFYEKFSAWVSEQNLLGNLPDLGEKRSVRSVRVSTSGYPLYVDDDGRARYQIQLKMIYTEGV